MWRNCGPIFLKIRTPSKYHEWHTYSDLDGPEINHLFSKYLGPEWANHADNSAVWHRVTEIPDGELWAVRQIQKRKLMGFIRERARAGWMKEP